MGWRWGQPYGNRVQEEGVSQGVGYGQGRILATTPARITSIYVHMYTVICYCIDLLPACSKLAFEAFLRLLAYDSSNNQHLLGRHLLNGNGEIARVSGSALPEEAD